MNARNIRRETRAFLRSRIAQVLGALCILSVSQVTWAQGADFDFDATFGATRGLDRTIESTRGGFIVVPEAAPYLDMSEEDLVMFTRNSVDLGQDAEAVLRKLADSLSQGALQGYNIQIEGHTCNLGSSEYNLELSRRRAQEVTKYLVGQAKIPRDRIRVVGYGETRPAHSNLSTSEQAKNRRVRIIRLEQGDGLGVTTLGELEEARFRAVRSGAAGRLIDAELWGTERTGAALRKLKNGESLASDGLLKLRLHVFEGCHVYVFFRGSSGDVSLLLPDIEDENAKYGRWLDRTQSDGENGGGFVLPEKGRSYYLDAIVGTETVFVLAARKIIANLEALKRRIADADTASGSVKALFPEYDEIYVFDVDHVNRRN